MRAHQARAALVVKAPSYARAYLGQRVSLGRQEVEVVTFARTDNPRPDIAPQQYAVIGRLATAAGIERRPVQHNALIGVSEQHGSGPLAYRWVFEVEAVGVVPIRISWRGHGCDSARIALQGAICGASAAVVMSAVRSRSLRRRWRQ